MPLQPKSVLRGHKASVHAAAFIRRNDRLITGDAEGFVVVWDLTIMRPRTVWRAHTNAILGIAAWGDDKIITHGRDNRLVVWRLGVGDEPAMSTALPLDPSPEERPQPWLLHLLEVNTMNFCAFASCCTPAAASTGPASELLVAVPNTLASEAIDIFHLPSQRRLHTVKLGDKHGMVMALSLFYRAGKLVLIAAYENGLVIVAELGHDGAWVTTYGAKAHSQSILSLDVSPDKSYFFTSSADAVIAKHPIPHVTDAETQQPTEPLTADSEHPPHTSPEQPTGGPSLLAAALASQPRPTAHPRPQGTSHVEIKTEPLKVVNTKHAGQQSLRIRSDARIFATAGWDARIRVYSTRTMREVAVLKWHQVGCYAVAFASVVQDGTSGELTDAAQADAPTSVAPVPKLVDVSVRDKRIRQTKTAHWLAAGSKDGKVSLWDVF